MNIVEEIINIKRLLQQGGGGGDVTGVKGNKESTYRKGNVNLTPEQIGALPDDTDIPTKTSDLVNDSNFVADANYNHTDNNYTTPEKTKLAGLVNYDDTSIKNRVSTIEGKEAGWDAKANPSDIKNAKITILQNGAKKGEFTVNQSSDITINLDGGGGGGDVTGVKGNSETTYRTGNVNITPENIGCNDIFKIVKATSSAVTVAANTYHHFTFSMGTVPTGYTAIGLTLVQSNHPSYGHIGTFLLAGDNTARIGIYNRASSAQSYTVTASALYIKNL